MTDTRPRLSCKTCGRLTVRDDGICRPCWLAVESRAVGDQKRCQKCKEIKEKTEFYKDRKARDLLTTRCKPCFGRKQNRKKVRQDHHEPAEYMGGSHVGVMQLREAW